MPRRSQRSTGAYALSKPTTQLMSMVMMLFVLGLMYSRARDPQTWRWLADDAAAEPERRDPRVDIPLAADIAAEDPAKPKKAAEAVVPGPTDQDPDEALEAAGLFAAISDKAKLDNSEMPAYWRLLKWARAQSFTALERRARSDVLYTQLWEQPEKYRGKLLRLRLHIKRIVDFDAPENSAGVKRVYEFWGWTDESKAYPYVVVTSELPPGMATGGDVSEEGVFVGYFLKVMAYKAFDKDRASPLLLGRIQAIDRPRARGTADSGLGGWLWPGCAALALVVGGLAWMRISRSRQALPLGRPVVGEPAFEDWLTKPESEPVSSPPSRGRTHDDYPAA